MIRKLKKQGVRRIRWLEFFPLSVLAVAGIGCGAWLFFQHVGISCVIAVLLSPFAVLKVRAALIRRFDRRFEKQFCDVLVVLSGSLAAGMRLERCIGEISENSATEYSLIRPEFERMYKLIQLNWPAERAFEEFAKRFDNRDIRMFSTALSTGIPAGMNLVELVRQIAATLRMKWDTEAEIERTLNLPKYNNRIILLMPFAAVFAVRMMAPSYAAALNSGIGRIIMLAASILLIIALVLGDLLGRIRY